MSSLLSAELSATCNALGTFDKRTGKYLIDEFTLNTVKDLIRYLRRDGEDHEIRRHFGQTKVVQTDLIPMLINHWENAELCDVTLRLLVNLTNPALLLYREEVPVERGARHNYLQILLHLQSYKEEAFSKVETWNVFAKKLTKMLEIDWSERDEDTGLVIERILILIRNVLHVPADLDREKRPENDASVHDQVLWALNQSGILDIILYMSSENEKQYFMHILEIISHLLREQNPSSLADAALQRSVDEKLRDDQELLSLRISENRNKLNKVKQYSGSRHSRFGGTYVVQNMKSISDNELISLKPLNKLSNLNFSGSKKSKLVKPKNRRPVESSILERRSAFAVRLFLKEFCIEFLNSSYNPLMHYVKDVLVRSKAQQNDESYYLWAVKFFMEFNRGHNFQVGLVSETMSVPMFHYVQQQMEKYYDMIKVEKKKFEPWVRRLHLALRAYKELLNTLLAMDKCTDPTVKESAKVLKSNIFYVLEYREFILSTFLNFDDNKMPRSYLVDLVETVHLFLKMLEYYCKKTGLVVQKKVRKKPKSKKPKKTKITKSREHRNIAQWEEVRAQLAVVLNGDILEHPPPFDAASDIPIDQQKGDCMKNIQKLMREFKFEDAVGIFRAAREVWPDEGIFGESGIQTDEELVMLETIYNTDIGVEITDVTDNVVETQEQSEYDEDVIDWILDNLVDNTRTRRGVIKKLKELGLIFGAPTKRSNKERATERVPKEFSEEEDQLLRELWEQYSEIPDPMSVIIARMPRKRQKRSYVDRMLELGIIQDKEECRKKRQKKSKAASSGTNDDGLNGSASDSDHFEATDSDVDSDEKSLKFKKTPIKKQKNNKVDKKKKQNQKSKEMATFELSANDIAKLLVNAVDNGLIDSLKWLAENLEEVALDQEAEGFDSTAEGTPLVPITGEEVQAMDSELFQQVLKGIGVVPPSDEQETYWRIPSKLHFNTIRKRREIIMKAVQKELVIETDTSTKYSTNDFNKNNKDNEESSNDDDLFNTLRKLRTNTDILHTDHNRDISTSSSFKCTRKRSRSIESDIGNRKNKMQKIDEVEESSVNDENDDILSFAKRTLQHEEFPDTEDILSHIPRTLDDDSDNDDEEDIVLPAKRDKKRRILIDDDSD
ncbi:hypothetical protein ACJJTC_008277 [Scirpophaga incertulas]